MKQLALPLDVPIDNSGQSVLIYELDFEKFSLVKNALRALRLKLPYSEPQVTHNISNRHEISAYLLRFENPLGSLTMAYFE